MALNLITDDDSKEDENIQNEIEHRVLCENIFLSLNHHK